MEKLSVTGLTAAELYQATDKTTRTSERNYIPLQNKSIK